MTPKVAFDVEAAARAAPDRPALVCGDEVWTYAALGSEARRVRDGWPQAPWTTLEGQARPEVVVHAVAALSARRPLVCLHPRATASERRAARAQVEASDGPPHLHEAAALLFTSGTSGAPKAVVLDAKALLAAAEASARNLGWQDGDRWLMSIPLGHVGGLSVLTRCLAARSTMVLPASRGPWRPQDFLQTVAAARVTIASLVPTQLMRLLRAELGPPPESLRAVLVGGAAAAPWLVAEARAAGYPVLTTYGLTEACAQVCTEAPGSPAPAGSVGRPLIEGSVRIADGHIEVNSAAVMRGYLGCGKLGFTEDGWLRTKDLGRLDADGNLFVLGRHSDLVVTGGENVYPAEVEAALRRLPDVQDALVFGRASAAWGEQVCAAVTLSSGAAVTPEGLASALRMELAAFKCPKAWAIVPELPLTTRGKPDRGGAAARLAAQLVELRPGG